MLDTFLERYILVTDKRGWQRAVPLDGKDWSASMAFEASIVSGSFDRDRTVALRSSAPAELLSCQCDAAPDRGAGAPKRSPLSASRHTYVRKWSSISAETPPFGFRGPENNAIFVLAS